MTSSRIRVLFLADYPNWAFGYVARSLAQRLRQHFDISIKYVTEQPQLDPNSFDLLYVFYWGEQWYKQFDIPAAKIIKEVASYRWKEPKHGSLSPSAFCERHLSDASIVTTPCRHIQRLLSGHRPNIHHYTNGIERNLFYPPSTRRGGLKIGWVGNPNDKCKGLYDILIPACAGRFDFRYSSGSWSRSRVANFYREIDVLAIASTFESQPLPLIESMASGCFPVTTNVGIVPEVVQSSENGLIVERSAENFREAFSWCSENLATIREKGLQNVRAITQDRDWNQSAEQLAEIIKLAAGSHETADKSMSLEAVHPSRARIVLGDKVANSRHRLVSLRESLKKSLPYRASRKLSRFLLSRCRPAT